MSQRQRNKKLLIVHDRRVRKEKSLGFVFVMGYFVLRIRGDSPGAVSMSGVTNLQPHTALLHPAHNWNYKQDDF